MSMATALSFPYAVQASVSLPQTPVSAMGTLPNSADARFPDSEILRGTIAPLAHSLDSLNKLGVHLGNHR